MRAITDGKGQDEGGDEPNAKQGRPVSGGRSRSVRYPRYGLEDAEQVAQRAFNLGARHVLQESVAEDLGYSGVANGVFKGKRAAAKYFGMIEYGGDDYVSVAEEWIHILKNEDVLALKMARRQAAAKPELYRQLFEAYKGRMLPQPDRLARELYLNQAFGISRDASADAARVFVETVKYAELLDSKGYLLDPDSAKEAETWGGDGEPEASVPTMPSPTAHSPAGANSPAHFQVSNDDMDRLEVRLRGGRKAFVLIPAPGTLSGDDKIRLKQFIDLILDDEDI